MICFYFIALHLTSYRIHKRKNRKYVNKITAIILFYHYCIIIEQDNQAEMMCEIRIKLILICLTVNLLPCLSFYIFAVSSDT